MHAVLPVGRNLVIGFGKYMTGSLMYAFEGDSENLRTQAYWAKNHDRPEPIEHNDLFFDSEKYL